MTVIAPPFAFLRLHWLRTVLLVVAFMLLAIGLTPLLRAQIDSDDRGVAPVDTSGSFEVTGIAVDIASRTPEGARQAGWREAQRRAWKLIWAKTNGGEAPTLSDSTLDSIVAAVVVEDEQISMNRYIARLGVLFDRARAGQLLGVTGSIARSAPILVIPVQWTGVVPQSFETRTLWQQAWARFRKDDSPLDYVRPTGTGIDPLLLNVMQTERPGRSWWRMILDQYGAADVVIPEVQLDWRYPGGPVIGRFTVRHGADARLISRFALKVNSDAALPHLLDEGVRRIDLALTQAMVDGRLRPDPSLVIESTAPAEEVLAETAKAEKSEGDTASPAPAPATPQNDAPTGNRGPSRTTP